MRLVFHYTDKDGYNAIVSQPIWLFVAGQPPGDRSFGAYFTNLPPDTKNLANRLRLPRRKVKWHFEFVDVDDLIALPGSRGHYVHYSPADYLVEQQRQQDHGATGL